MVDVIAFAVDAVVHDTTVFLDVPREELRRRLAERWSDLEGEALRVKMEENDRPNAELVVTESRAAARSSSGSTSRVESAPRAISATRPGSMSKPTVSNSAPRAAASGNPT